MADRTYVYVDGESHFIRSECAWRALHGGDADLERLRHAGQQDEHLVIVVKKAKVFWTRRMNPGVFRSFYFTAAVGDSAAMHKLKVDLKQFELEPRVINEQKCLADRRGSLLLNSGIVEKAKGVDIALAVQMLTDAFGDHFELCHLYTSDADFAPLIEVVRARGKQVYVHGYKAGLAAQSPLLHVADQFVDLEKLLRDDCVMAEVAPCASDGGGPA